MAWEKGVQQARWLLLAVLALGVVAQVAEHVSASGSSVGYGELPGNLDIAGLSSDAGMKMWSRAAELEGVSLEDFLGRVFENKPMKGLSQVEPQELKFYLQNNYEDQENIFMVFRPERPSLTIEDYQFEWSSSNQRVLRDSNVNFTFVSETVDNIEAYNITFDLIFDDFVGITDLTVTAIPTFAGSENFENYSVTVPITAGGFVLYDPAVPFDGDNAVVTGADRNNQAPTYRVGTGPGGLINYGVYVQYLNGSTSNTTVVSFAPVEATVQQETSIVIYDSSTCSINGGIWEDSDSMTLDPACGYGFNENTDLFNVYFALQQQPERAGVVRLEFDWPDFEDGELYENFFELNVSTTSGPPELQPVLTDVTPRGPFLTTGGEAITFTGYNLRGADSYSFTVLTDSPWTDPNGTLGGNDDFQTIRFTTQPGTGQNYNWRVELISGENVVEAADNILPEFLFSYVGLPQLIAIIPDNTSVIEGGIVIQLIGEFPSFDPENTETDRVTFNDNPLSRDVIINYTSTEIFFILPAQDELVPPGLFDYLVGVVINQEQSNRLPFYFTPVMVEIEVEGAVLLPNGTYSFEDGTASFIAIVTQQNRNVTYVWSVQDLQGNPIPVSGSLTDQSFFLQYDELPTINAEYVVSVTVTNAFGQTATDSVTVIKSPPGVPRIIVSLLPVDDRTPSFPDVPMSVTAEVDVLNSPPNISITYIWTFNGEQYEFTSSSTVAENGTTPSRYGRVFTVPQEDLVVMSEPQEVSLRAFVTNDPGISTTVSTRVLIYNLPLVAFIRDGSLTAQLSSGSDLVMYATNSYDPDVLSGDQTAGLTYNWLDCIKSTQENFFDAQPCSELVGEGASYTITAAEWEAAAIDGAEVTYFRFNMTVSKGERTSPVAILDVEYIPSVVQPFAQLEDVVITYADGSALDRTRVNPLQGIVVRPTTPDQTVTWTFSIRTLSGPTDLAETQSVASPGYWVFGEASSLPLYLAPGAFVSSGFEWLTTFVIEVTFAGADTQESRFATELQTISEPQIVIGEPSITTGDETTVFRVTAFVDFPDPQYFANFLYFFRITNQDDSTDVYCVDGCSGKSRVQFSVPASGTYQISVELRDATGVNVFGNATSDTTITVTATSNIEETATTTIDDCFAEGDHACVEITAYQLALSLAGGTRRRNLDIASTVRQSEETIATVANALDKLRRSASNSFPNTDLIENYVVTCQLFSRQGFEVFQTSDMLTDLLVIMESAVDRKPDSVLIGDRAKENIVATYVNLPEIARQLGLNTRSTARRRLLQNENPDNKDLLNVYSLQGTQVPKVFQSNEQCGYENTQTITPRGEAGELFGTTTVQTTIRCNPAQNTEPITAATNALSVCDEVFNNQFIKYGFSLVSSFDYPWEGGAEDSDLPASNVRIPQVILRTYGVDFPESIPATCFQLDSVLNTSLFPDSELGSLNVSNYQLVPLNEIGATGPFYQRTRTGFLPGEERIEGGTLTQPLFISRSGVFVSDIVDRLLITTPTPAVTVPPTQLPTSGPTTPTPTPTSSSGGSLTGGAIAGIVIGILLFIILAILVAWLIATYCFVGAAAAPADDAFEYVERDIYGRGFVVEEALYADEDMEEGEYGDDIDGYEEATPAVDGEEI